MASTVHFLRRTGRGLRSFVGTIFGGLWLIVLYGLTVWLVVGSLATFQIRNELRQIEGAPSFADVGRAYNHYRKRERVLFDELQRRENALYGEFWSRENALWKYEEKRAQIQEAVVPGSTLPFDEFYVAPEFKKITAECSSSERSTPEGICGLIEDFDELRKRVENTDEQIADMSFDERWAGLIEMRAEATSRANELRANEKLTKYFDSYEFFANAKADSKGVLFDETQFDDGLFDISYMFLLHWPLQILVLQMTIIMGVLGSVLTMTWSFIKRDSDFTLRRFIILPFVGGMSAFIIFIFIKAGQLTLTGGSGEESLNPFVLSFVGIISGLLSERAYARMSQVGSNFFRTGEESPRYGIRMREALDAASVSEQELATYLQLSDEDTAKIIDGKAAADAAQQQLIAACLRRDIRELFTDLPPKAAVVAPATTFPAAGAIAEQPS